ncbi:uncharacterized protein [Bactrocera oleae]|uniref:uncharacterized protein n=1 Tax=Bactrocera oleae TaxID=104688 RepID=UPI00387E7713
MEVPLMFGYDNKNNVRRVITTECQQIPTTSEAVIWAEIDGDYGPNKWRSVEPTKESTPNSLIGKTLAMTRQDKRVLVRVLNECKLPIKLSKGAILGQEIEAVINCEIRLEEDSMDENDISSEITAWTEELEANYQAMAKQLHLRYSSIFDKMMPNQDEPKADRSVSLGKREAVSQTIREMSESIVTEPSASPWSAPVVLVKKKDGNMRLGVD